MNDDHQPGPRRPPWLRRLGWLVLIWSASVVTLAGVAALMRGLMNALGLQV
ncbi:DUF2474 domain-containing protein [Alloalcanivorax sp. C16-1]|uniref:DUF2474 domain-containing protein n=1 Tax=Alloalcanivorax sp. C16-1 TaxID=3390051 RepID=UPI0039707BA3